MKSATGGIGEMHESKTGKQMQMHTWDEHLHSNFVRGARIRQQTVRWPAQGLQNSHQERGVHRPSRAGMHDNVPETKLCRERVRKTGSSSPEQSETGYDRARCRGDSILHSPVCASHSVMKSALPTHAPSAIMRSQRMCVRLGPWLASSLLFVKPVNASSCL